MTEADWLACEDPEPMLQFLCASQASDRKLRLLACACCRRVWHRLTNPHSRRAVEVAERFADGRATPRELGLARARAVAAPEPVGVAAWWATTTKPSGPISNVFMAAGALVRPEAGSRVVIDWTAEVAKQSRWQAGLVREVMGNPFRPRLVEPVCLAWDGGLVRHLAEGIYEEQAFERMGVLGDALEDAGCTDEVILTHCRHGGDHVRGCWVLDLLLDRD
jgi:hypothetical protein